MELETSAYQNASAVDASDSQSTQGITEATELHDASSEDFNTPADNTKATTPSSVTITEVMPEPEAVLLVSEPEHEPTKTDELINLEHYGPAVTARDEMEKYYTEFMEELELCLGISTFEEYLIFETMLERGASSSERTALAKHLVSLKENKETKSNA